MRISDWSSDVCSSDLFHHQPVAGARRRRARERAPPQAVERRARCAAGRRHLSQAELPRRRAAGDEFDDPYRPADDRRPGARKEGQRHPPRRIWRLCAADQFPDRPARHRTPALHAGTDARRSDDARADHGAGRNLEPARPGTSEGGLIAAPALKEAGFGPHSPASPHFALSIASRTFSGGAFSSNSLAIWPSDSLSPPCGLNSTGASTLRASAISSFSTTSRRPTRTRTSGACGTSSIARMIAVTAPLLGLSPARWKLS